MPGSNGTANKITLALALTERLATLGMSRRELCRRTGLSRQTLHKIENLNHTNLDPKTYATLDEVLYWKPGTTFALAKGDGRLLMDADILIRDEESGKLTRWELVERITKMTIDELDALVAHLDGTNGKRK